MYTYNRTYRPTRTYEPAKQMQSIAIFKKCCAFLTVQPIAFLRCVDSSSVQLCSIFPIEPHGQIGYKNREVVCCGAEKPIHEPRHAIKKHRTSKTIDRWRQAFFFPIFIDLLETMSIEHRLHKIRDREEHAEVTEFQHIDCDNCRSKTSAAGI